MDIKAILDELASALTATGLQVFSCPPDAADYPAIYLAAPTLITYSSTLGGSCQIDVAVRLVVQNADLASSFELVYQLLSYNSSSDTIPDLLTTHTPINYKQLKVSDAQKITPLGETGISVDVNLTIYS